MINKALQTADSKYTTLDKQNRQEIADLIIEYREILKALSKEKEHPVKKQAIERMAALRELDRQLESSEKTPEAPQTVDFALHRSLNNEALIPVTDRQAFESAVESFRSLHNLFTETGALEDFDRFASRIATRFNMRQNTVFSAIDDASTITALRGATFELSRIIRVIRQNPEQIDFASLMEGITLDFKGYPKTNAVLSEPPPQEIKDSTIEFDVPIVRDGKPYVYETKSYPRKQYGKDIQTRNQALKYKTAIDKGLVAGATIEVAGRVDMDFLFWAMGTGVNDIGAIPEVEIIYNVPLPSGKEYRFVLKRGLQRTEGPEGLTTKDIGLEFHNEEKYDEADMDVILGVEKSIADKSIIQLISATNISQEQTDSAREAFLGETNIATASAFQDAFVRLLGLDNKDSESFDRALRNFFGDKKVKKLPEGQDRFYTPAVIREKVSALLGVDIEGRFQQTLHDLWNLMFNDPGKISSAKVYEIYENLRSRAVRTALEKKKQTLLINKDNKASAVSEYANPEYVERTLRTFLDYLAKNPHIAAVKRHYIIDEARIPEAVGRTMNMLKKIADYERAYAKRPEAAEFVARRAEMGYTGLPEGVALDIEHILTDVLYSMNKEGLERNRIINQIFKNKEDWREFFDEGGDPDKVYARFRTEEELDQLLESSPAASDAFKSLSKKSQGELRKVAKEGTFVRSYDWPERFSEVTELHKKLVGQDRRYQEIHVFDPTDGEIGKTTKQLDTSDEEVDRTEMNIIRENIERARAFMERTGRESSHKRPIAVLEKQMETVKKTRDQRIEEAQQEARNKAHLISTQQKELRNRKLALENQMKGTTGENRMKLESEVSSLEGQIAVLNDERSKTFAGVQTISAEYASELKQMNSELEAIYRKAVPKEDWDSFAKRIVHRVDQNLMKVIYAVNAEEEIIVQEEIIRGDVSGRAAHSELVRGRNIFGAGEMAFRKQNGQWILVEINNGSGHYRPDADSNLFYVRRLLAEKGINTDNAEIVDCILRGRKLREMSLY